MVLEILGTEVTCPHCGVKQYVQKNDLGIHVAYCDDREADALVISKGIRIFVYLTTWAFGG